MTAKRSARTLFNKITLLLLALLLSVPLHLSLPLSVSAAPPSGFQSNPLITSGLDGPSGFEIAPDGRIFILERTGKVKIFKDGQLLATPFAELPAASTGDRGLIGIAFDPDYAVNCYVYFYYTSASDLLNRLVRFNACGDVGTDGPFVLYQTNSPSQELHVGGSIQFGPDGKLYFAVGDNGYPPNGQDLSNPHGKILRINKDGTIPADNPFYGQAGKLGEIWAYGFRNPWRFQFDASTGNLFGGDVGDYSWEEVNRIVKGGNYGWPLKEGYCTAACEGLTDPIYAYEHAGFSAAVTGGPVYRGTAFPAQYQGDLFFADYAQGFIKHMDLDAAGNNLGVSDFDLNAGSVVDLKVAADGSMYYITYYPGRLYKVTYDSGNSAPTANATADVKEGIEPLTVNFSSAGSSDPEGMPLTYLWQFGDGTTSTAANPTKTYTQKGTYTVELTVSDGVYSTQAVPVVIQVGVPPTVNISVPADGYQYQAGESITYNAFASDAAGFDLNDADMSTDVIFHHDTHTHPFLDNLIGRANTFTIPDYGEAAANTWFEITTTATDANGLSATDTVNIYPKVVSLTFTSDKPGVGVNVDGVPYPAGHTTQGVVNFKREISATPIKQGLDGIYYQFEGWSDNGAIRHMISTPAVNTTYTARYAPAPAFKAEYFNNKTLTGAPTLSKTEPEINNNWEFGSPDPTIPADEWSARYSKNQFFTAGRYKFTTATDDGVRLYIDGKLVVDAWYGQTAAHTAVVDLTEGMHEVKMEYFEDFGGAYARLNWDTTPDQPTAITTDFQADYFNNVTLTGTPALSRNETTVDHDWMAGSPDASVQVDNFSARWNKTENLDAGTYKFTVTADDGVRLFVNDELLIDKWIDQAPTTYEVSKSLTAGSHTIKMEYYEKGGGAVAKLNYALDTSPPPADTTFAASYWNTPTAGTAPAIPTTTPDLSRSDADINFDWASGSPDPGISVDHFVARWVKNVDLAAGTYRFTTTSDDGIRVYIDGNLVLDQWNDHAPTTHSVDVPIAAGQHELKVEYYENAGGAVAAFGYQLAPDTVTNDYKAEFWNTPTAGTAPAMPTTAPDLLRQDTAIAFDWAASSPSAEIATDHFIGRWSKEAAFTAGTYTFSTTSDDGVRVLIDGVAVIDQWNDHAATTHTAAITLTEGTHQIVIEYYENAGNAVMQFSYEKQTTALSNEYQASFWNTPTAGTAPAIPTATPDLSRTDMAINFDWTSGSPDPSINVDHFVARWKKTTDLAAGTYRFTATSDDGVRVLVNGVLVIDQWNDHAPITHTVDIPLAAGQHEIVVEYYENAGGAVMSMQYQLLQ